MDITSYVRCLSDLSINSSLAYQLADLVFSVLRQLLAALGDLIGLILDAVGD
jgi:hypothetical protein